ncbi:hypothetical protein COMA1_50115 [Candidatus Nitrospira nitrosa]|uniref:Uncharacterized protein n=1 Tax=Candidatus Nitrospira nitrosa TaxID=1742972 RepID=A0A0S4LPB9_9BACT|nr:hypothetical protein COMA1_50115 [Candidatus Nitrospira nitrosa]
MSIFLQRYAYRFPSSKTDPCDRYNNREETGMGPALTTMLSGGLMPLHAGEIPLTLVVSKVDTEFYALSVVP